MNTCVYHPPGAMFGMPVGGKWGGLFSDLVRVPFARSALLPLPSGLEPTHLASLSDNIPLGYELTVPRLECSPGADVLVVGGVGSIATLLQVRLCNGCGVDPRPPGWTISMRTAAVW
jgi:alcohol dehydrogenase